MTDALEAGGLVPEALARRRYAGAAALALVLHLAVAAAILWWPRVEVPVEEPPRLVFIEPAPPPPPPLGRPDGEGEATDEVMSSAPGPGTVPDEMRPTEPAKPKVEKAAAEKPAAKVVAKKPVKAVAKKAPATPAAKRVAPKAKPAARKR